MASPDGRSHYCPAARHKLHRLAAGTNSLVGSAEARHDGGLLKCVALLADLAAAMAYDLPNTVDRYGVLNSGLWKPISGYERAACQEWLQKFEE
jgi:hypothetical protein